MRKIVRGAYYTGTITLFVLATMAGFSQTRAFKAWLLDRALVEVDRSLNGEVRVARIDGNLVTGLRLEGVEVVERGVVLAKVERVEITYDPLAIALRKIGISSVTLLRPEILMYRSLDSTWNVSRLVKPTDPDSGGTPWTVAIRQARLQDAAIRLIDSLTLADRSREGRTLPDSAVDYAHLVLTGVDLSGGLESNATELHARLDGLEGTLQHPAIHIRKIAGRFRMGPDNVSIEGLQVETDRSTLSGSASLGTDLAHVSHISQLERTPVSVDLRATPIDLRELRQFLYPSVEFLDRKVVVTVAGRGTFGDLAVERVSLQTPRSLIQMRGIVTNLHRPEELTLDVEGYESLVNSDDIRSLLPGLKIPDWNKFGDVRFHTSFKGMPAGAFDAQFIATTERGAIDARAAISIGPQFTYKGSATLSEFDLGSFVGDGTELTNLNGLVTFDGSDTDLKSIMGVVRAEIDSSVVSGTAVGRTVIVVNAAEGNYDVSLATQTEAGGARGSGRWSIQQGGFEYGLNLTVNAVDAAQVIGHPAYVSDLNGTISGGGRFSDEEGRTDSMLIQLSHSRFGAHDLDPTEVFVRYHAEGEQQELNLDSDPVSISVDGRFTPTSLITSGTHVASTIGRYFTSTFGALDSLRAFGETAPRTAISFTPVESSDSIDVRFAIDVRDLSVIGKLSRTRLRGDAVAVVDLAGPVTGPRIRLDLLGRSAAYADSIVQIDARDIDATVTSTGLVDSTLFSSFDMRAGITAGLLHVNGRRFDDAAAEISFRGTNGTIGAQGLLDSTLQFFTGGTTRFASHLFELTLDTLSLDVHSYAMSAVEPVLIAFGRDGFLFRRLQIATEGQEITGSGYFSPAGVSDLNIGISGFLAGDLRHILGRSSYAGLVQDVGGIVNGSLAFRGTMDHPNLRLELAAEGVRLQETVYGRLDVRMGYFEQNLDLYARLQSRTDEVRARPDLLLTGRVPYSMTLKGSAPGVPQDGAIDLELLSQGLDLRFLEPFLVDVTRAMRGTLTCDLRLKGTVASPLYEGAASIRDGRFYFVPTKFEYLLDGDLKPDGDLIRLENVVIRNTAEDFADGRMRASGALALEGIRLRSFDLGFDGQLMVMREDSSRLMGQKFYGDLTAATGPQGLSWQGTLKRSLLTGTVLVRNAQITLPPDRESPRYAVRVIDVIRSKDTTQSRARFTLEPETTEAPLAIAPVAEPDPSFVDRIDFNLVLETQGSTQVRFIFNRQTNDVLFADLRGRMGFQRNSSTTRLTGEVEVTNRSYYNFLKRFGATGKIFFTGDPLNPELDIVARYEGVHQAVVTPGTSGSSAGANGVSQSREEDVAVILYLKGPRSKLETRFDVEVEQSDGSKVIRRGDVDADVEADAIAFIMSNKFRDELTEQQQTTALGQNLGYGLASGLVTGPLSETLRRTTKGSIQSLDVIYYGGGEVLTGTDIRLSGQLGDAIYRVGGRVFESLGNSNIVVEVPMSWVMNSPKLRNLILTLERKADDNRGLVERSTSTGARLLYRFTF